MLETFMQNVVQVFAFFATFVLLMSPILTVWFSVTYIVHKNNWRQQRKRWRTGRNVTASVALMVVVILDIALIATIIGTPGNIFYDSWNMGF